MGTTTPSIPQQSGSRFREAPSRAFTPLTRTLSQQAGAVPVAPANPERRSVLITNTQPSGGASVFVTNDRNAHQDSAYELTPGEGLTLTTAAAVFAFVVGSTPAAVKVIDETGCA